MTWKKAASDMEEEEAEEEGIIEIAYAHLQLILTLVVWIDKRQHC